MLKRLRVRSKLLLLLAPVLAAVVFFAAASAQDRFDAATVAENEAEIATLADAGDRLLLALQIEQIRTIAAQAGADVDVESAVAATSEAAAHFEEVAARVAAFAGPQTAPALSTARQRVATIPELRARVDQGGMSAGANQVQFDAILFSLDRLGDALLVEVADVGLYRDLAAHQRLTRAQDALGRLVARAEVGVIEGLDRATNDDLRVQLVAATLALEQFRADATEDQVRILDRTTSRLGLPESGDALAATLGALQAGDPARALEGWTERGESWLGGLAEVGSSLASQAVAAAESRADVANGEAAGFLVLASTIVVAALLLAVLVGRSISRPLRRLTRDAQRLADDELPTLVDTLRSGRAVDRDVLEPIAVSGRDETADLARAVASIQEMTVEVAEEQSAL
ncbi:MAG: HAMP domain-containing protein, partial [Actinomyces sp.]